jgi:hypothetical protein
MAGITIGRVTIGSPEGWVFERQDGGGLLYNTAFYPVPTKVSIEDAARVEAWMLGQTARPALPDDVRAALVAAESTLRGLQCPTAAKTLADLRAKYPEA